MQHVWHMLLLSGAMFLGSYISGFVPFAFTLNENKIKQMNVAGSGLLVGTALSVIIPEGVSAIYSQKHHEEHHGTDSLIDGDEDEHVHEDDDHQHDEVHQYVGLSLLFGFLLMLVVDHIPGGHGHSHDEAVPMAESEKLIETGEQEVIVSESKASTATLGLVVHAAADGLALGAASASDSSSLQFIVFLAIMLHKAPASFGLVAFLLQRGIERSKIRCHLLIFALAAPITAMLSYMFLYHALEVIPGGAGSAMLFSAGTFLYVATVHVLPEVGPLDKFKLFLMILGSIVPLLFSLGHSH